MKYLLVCSMNECKCIPWDMIRPNGSDHVPMCERYGNGCFYSKMKNDTHAKKHCYCLPQCNTKIYQQSSAEKIPLDMAQVCREFPDLTERMAFMQLGFQDFKFYFDEYSKSLYEPIKGSWDYYQRIKNEENPDPIWHLIKYIKKVKVPNPMSHYLYHCDSDVMKNLFIKDVAVIEIHLMDQSYLKGVVQVKYVRYFVMVFT